MGCIPLCTWERREVVDRWHFFGPFVLRFWVRRHSQWRFMQMAVYGSSKNVVQRRALVFWAIAYPAQPNYRGDACTWQNATMGQRETSSRSWLAARQPLQVKFLAELLAVSCTVVLCVVRAIGTVLFATKVCTVHVGHCLPISCTSGWTRSSSSHS